MALLATAYEQPVETCVLAEHRRACEHWTEGDKALAHIHLAHVGLPPCGLDQALRLFVADELIETGVTPAALMKAQGFDAARLDFSKANFNPAQPRVPAGSGRESGEWTDGEANFTPVAFRSRRGRHGRGGIDSIRSFLEHLRELLKPKEGEPAREAKPREPEVAKPETEPVHPPTPERRISTPKPSDFVGQGYGKLGGGHREAGSRNSRTRSSRHRNDGRTRSITERPTRYVDHPLIVLQQSRGRVFYLSDNAAVVINPRGRVITTYSASEIDEKIKALLEHVH